jgi:hypothetical protein
VEIAFRFVASFSGMLQGDRERWGIRVCRMAWFLGLTVLEYHELEEGERLPDFEIVDRIERPFGWPRSFARTDRSGR